jgi:hypothetical protein
MDGKRRHEAVHGHGPMGGRRFAGGLVALLATVFVLVTASAAAAATVTVVPANGTATVGQLYCVTATVSEGHGGVFEFTAQPTSGSAATPNPTVDAVQADGNRQAQFCLTSMTPGEVLITATARSFNIGQTPSGIATVTFVSLPIDKDQCKDGGWKTFGTFKNQGDCVSFVATGGTNPPSN